MQRLEDKRGLRSHLVIYLSVNAMLVVIWAVSGAGYFWPIWPILGWGVGLAISAWSVYGRRPVTDEEIREEMQRHVRVD